jgi:hypothetical protein
MNPNLKRSGECRIPWVQDVKEIFAIANALFKDNLFVANACLTDAIYEETILQLSILATEVFTSQD